MPRKTNRVGLTAVPKESKQQEALFEWMSYLRVPVFRMDAAGNLTANREWVTLTDLAFAVPNGTSIAGTAKQRAMYMQSLKKQGFKVGVSDIVIPYPTVAYHGLFIELKREKSSKVTKDQIDWRNLMRRLDYRAEIVVGWDAARAVVQEYFGTELRVVRTSPVVPSGIVI